jgi:hypothetical protein
MVRAQEGIVMKMFGRRQAAGMIASAPLAAPMAGKMAAEVAMNRAYPVAGMPGDVASTGQALQRAFTPPGVREFQEARRGIEQIHRSRFEMWNTQLFDYNIASLKSVSQQHKVRMQHEYMQRIAREQESLIDALARKFNVWEWWKGKDALERY